MVIFKPRPLLTPTNERISGSNWIGDFVSQTAILNGMPERQTFGQEPWWVQGSV